MTQAERDRLVALKKAKKKLITQKQAAEEIGVTERQVRRLLHKLHEITVSKETLRGWMVEAGLWKAGRRRVVEAHPWRPRRSRFGESVQWDTSLLLDHDGYLPSFAVVTEGKTSEIKVARTLRFAPGTILAIDRGYIDYVWFRELTQEEVYFVTRMKALTSAWVEAKMRVPAQNRAMPNVLNAGNGVKQLIWTRVGNRTFLLCLDSPALGVLHHLVLSPGPQRSRLRRAFPDFVTCP
jgi:hypothetical protein